MYACMLSVFKMYSSLLNFNLQQTAMSIAEFLFIIKVVVLLFTQTELEGLECIHHDLNCCANSYFYYQNHK